VRPESKERFAAADVGRLKAQLRAGCIVAGKLAGRIWRADITRCTDEATAGGVLDLFRTDRSRSEKLKLPTRNRHDR